MTIRRPRTPVPTLRHAAFFEALAGIPSYHAEARALTATLLTLRLGDEWLRRGTAAVDDPETSLSATRRAIDACDDDAILQAALRQVVDAMCTVKDPDPYVLRARLEPIAAIWDARQQPQLAADIRGDATTIADPMRAVTA
jgi:hypothetical protein